MQSHDPQRQESESILLVDDNSTNLLVLEEIIMQNLKGCRVLTAESGKEGIRLARLNPVDAVFVDMQMPGMDGIETCRRLKGDPATADIPVVLITSHRSSAELRAQGIDAGAQDFISRPIRNVEMLARIKAILRIKSQEDRLRAENRDLKEAMGEKSRSLRWITGLLSMARLDSSDSLYVSGKFEGGVSLESFQKEIYEQIPPPLKKTLLKLSLPEELPLVLAEAISEVEGVRDVLEYLERQDFYVETTERRPLIFRIAPPLRSFLRGRAISELSPPVRQEVFRRSADWFLDRDLPEKALRALLEGGDIAQAEEVASVMAMPLFIQNRLGDVPIDLLPPEEDVAPKFPWLVLLKGILCFETDPDTSRTSFEMARELFLEHSLKDGELAAGLLLLLYHSLLGTKRGGEISLVSRPEVLCEEIRDELPSDLRSFAASCCALGRFFLQGDLDAAEARLSSDCCLVASSPPALSVMHYTLRGYLVLHSGRWDRARKKLEYAFAPNPSSLPGVVEAFRSMFETDLLRIGGFPYSGNESFFPEVDTQQTKLRAAILAPSLLLWRIGSDLAQGRVESAREVALLEEYEPSLRGVFRERFLDYKALIASLRGDDDGIARNNEGLSLKGDPLFAAERAILRAVTLAGLGEKDVSHDLIDTAVELAAFPPSSHLLPSALLQRAFLRLNRGDKKGGGEDLREGLALVKEHRVRGGVGMTPESLDLILSNAHSAGVEKVFAEQMALRRLERVLGEDGERIPVVTVRLLGGFSVEVNRRTIADWKDFGGVQRDFFELLLRKPHFQIGQEEVQSILWPETDQRKARSNLDSLLLRFRKFSVKEMDGYTLRDYIVLRKGVLSLRHCRVDTALFLESLQRGVKYARKKEFWHANFHFREAYALWVESRELGGEGFNRDSYPEILQSFLEGVLCWADLLVRREETELALRVCEEGIRLDPTNDEIIRFLYVGYLRMKSAGRAARVLESYRRALEEEEYVPEEIEDILRDVQTFSPISY